MKYLKFIILLLLAAGCSSDSDSGIKDGTGGSLAIFVLKGDYLYTVDNASLNVFSLANISHPEKVNEKNIGFNIETLYSNGEYLFIGSQNGMYIYSVADPANPVELSSVEHVTSCDPVVANETHSFVTLYSNNACGNDNNLLEIYDTSNPTNPVLVHQQNLISPKGLGLYHNYLFVCAEEIKIFDVQHPESPVLAGSIDAACFDVIIKGDDLYAISDHHLYRYHLDVNNITAPELVSQVSF
ncbi:MAG TPA: hypothetical protein VGB50_11265 [Flavobacterium sp.]|jgi:hypothetical protein